MRTDNLSRKLAAILHADVVASTILIGACGSMTVGIEKGNQYIKVDDVLEVVK
jgi:hypothetical protein